MPDKDDTDSEDEGLAAGGESKAEDAGSAEPEAKRKQYFPASLGLSVFLPPGPTDGSDHVEVVVSWADYDIEEIQEDRTDRKKRGWRRVPRGPYTVKVPLDQKALSAPRGVRWPESSGLCFRGELRKTDMEGLEPGTRVLSLFLVNDRMVLEKDRDLSFAFQVKFSMRYAKGFIPRPNRRGEGSDDEDPRVLALLFRDHVEWAVGHNTSLGPPKVDAHGHVTELCTTQLPAYAVKGVRHEAVPGVVTGMRELSEMDGPALKNALTPLVEAYASWIEKQNGELRISADADRAFRNIPITCFGASRSPVSESRSVISASRSPVSEHRDRRRRVDKATRHWDSWPPGAGPGAR